MKEDYPGLRNWVNNEYSNNRDVRVWSKFEKGDNVIQGVLIGYNDGHVHLETWDSIDPKIKFYDVQEKTCTWTYLDENGVTRDCTLTIYNESIIEDETITMKMSDDTTCAFADYFTCCSDMTSEDITKNIKLEVPDAYTGDDV